MMNKVVVLVGGVVGLCGVGLGCAEEPLSVTVPAEGGQSPVPGQTSTPTAVPDPSHQWVFFDSLRGLDRDIFAVHADGSGLWQVVSDPGTDQEPAVSPDGRWLAFSSDRSGSFQIYVMALPAGSVTHLDTDNVPARQPAWSRDGNRLAYVGGDGLVVMNRDGSNRRLVQSSPSSAFDAVEYPTFAPDGELYADRHNYVVRFGSDDSPNRITPGVAGTLQHPSISADGRSMAFSTGVCNGARPSIFLVPLGAPVDLCSPATQVSPASAPSSRFPSLSANGLIAYESGLPPAKLAVRAADGNTTTITDGDSDDRNPTWGTLP